MNLERMAVSYEVFQCISQLVDVSCVHQILSGSLYLLIL